MVVIEMTPGTWHNRRDEVGPTFVVLDAGIFAATRSATAASGVAAAPAITAPTPILVPKVVAA